MCGADDKLVVARAALHFWEEPPISGRAGSGAVFFSHCPLGCVYCQNADIADGRAGESITIDRLGGICLELQKQGALTIDFVTPTHYAPQIRAATALARERGLELPVVWNTSGYETVVAICGLAGTVDVYLSDFKYADPALARRYSHAADYPAVALSALDVMVEQVGLPRFDEVAGQRRIAGGVVVRHLMLPGALDDSKRVVELLHRRYGGAVVLSLMNQYTPLREFPTMPVLGEKVSDAAYEELLDFADDLGVEGYFWQEGGTAEKSFIPPFDLTGVAAH